MRYRYTSLLLFASLGACTAPVSQWEATGVSSEAISAGQYQITPSYASGQCLETISANTGNMGTADTWSCSSSGDPNWNLVSISSGVYEIRQVLGGKCLTVNSANYTNGTNLVLWDCQGQAGSRWNAVQVGSYTTFKSNDNTNKCLDIYGGGSSNGSKAEIWDCNAGTNQQFSLNASGGSSQSQSPPPPPSSLSAALSVADMGSSQYAATLTVTNSSNTSAINWQVGVNLNQSSVDQVPSYGGTTAINNGSVYFANNLAIFTPVSGNTLPGNSSVQVKFVGNKGGSNWSPAIANVDGIAGSSAPLTNDGIDHVARAAATAALNVITAWENGRTTNTLVDFAIIDSHSFTLSSDGTQILFDGWGPGGWNGYVTQEAITQLALAQQDPSVASYLVSGLLSCFADASPNLVYGFNGAALRGWSYSTTPQNITLATSYGTNNINRVGSNANGTEQIALVETVNPNSEDQNFGLVVTLSYGSFVSNGSDPTYTKYHNGNSFPCSPFNGPGGAANPYLVISVNGNSVGARQQVPVSDCPYVNHCSSTVVVDPVAYASAGQFYNGSGNLIGPSSNPFSLDPNVTVAYNPDHRSQWAMDVYGRWGQFSKATFLNGKYYYKWSMCSGGAFNANGC